MSRDGGNHEERRSRGRGGGERSRRDEETMRRVEADEERG
jgi:hypothetical protein